MIMRLTANAVGRKPASLIVSPAQRLGTIRCADRLAGPVDDAFSAEDRNVALHAGRAEVLECASTPARFLRNYLRCCLSMPGAGRDAYATLGPRRATRSFPVKFLAKFILSNTKITCDIGRR
jgi:hypothetical protein